MKCFTAVEIQHLSPTGCSNSRWRKHSPGLRDAGLDSLTGGGAEILDDGVRDRICRGKETSDEWIETHRTWHRMGGRSTCTMLFGHVETMAQRVGHLRRLRELQDETGGFTGFVPFAFVPEGVTRELRELPHTTGFDELRNLAVSRLYLDNFDARHGVLGGDGFAAGAGGARLRRGRSARHDHGGKNLPDGRCEHGQGADRGRVGLARIGLAAAGRKTQPAWRGAVAQGDYALDWSPDAFQCHGTSSGYGPAFSAPASRRMVRAYMVDMLSGVTA